MSTKIKITSPIIAVHARNWQVATKALRELQEQVQELHTLLWNSIYACERGVDPKRNWSLDIRTMELTESAKSPVEELLVAVMTGRRPSTSEDDGEPGPDDTIH